MPLKKVFRIKDDRVVLIRSNSVEVRRFLSRKGTYVFEATVGGVNQGMVDTIDEAVLPLENGDLSARMVEAFSLDPARLDDVKRLFPGLIPQLGKPAWKRRKTPRGRRGKRR